jgi:hypothetical protein
LDNNALKSMAIRSLLGRWPVAAAFDALQLCEPGETEAITVNSLAKLKV